MQVWCLYGDFLRKLGTLVLCSLVEFDHLEVTSSISQRTELILHSADNIYKEATVDGQSFLSPRDALYFVDLHCIPLLPAFIQTTFPQTPFSSAIFILR